MAAAASPRMNPSRLQAPVSANSARQPARSLRPCAPARSWMGNPARSMNCPGSNGVSVIRCLLSREARLRFEISVSRAVILTAKPGLRQLPSRLTPTLSPLKGGEGEDKSARSSRPAGQPPLLPARGGYIFRPAIMDRGREVLGQEGRNPFLAADTPAG